MINLNNDWLRQDIATPSTYYGYSLSPNPQDTQSVWAIRQITASGSVSTVTWTNGGIMNGQLDFISTWSNRYASFASPTASLGVTYSTAVGTNSFGITSTTINTKWNTLPGIDQYNILITDQNNVTYGSLGNPIVLNPYNATLITNTNINKSNYTFLGIPGMTYSITITPFNVAGSTSSTVTVAT